MLWTEARKNAHAKGTIMDNRPDPLDKPPTSQLGAPPSDGVELALSPEEGSPANPNKGAEPPPSRQPKGAWLSHSLEGIPGYNKLPASVRDFASNRPAAAVGIAVLAGLGLMVARRRPR